MQVRRVRKQLFYATLFFAVVTGFVSALFVVIKGPAVPEISLNARPPVFAAVELLEVSYVADDTTVDAVARLYNPNPRAGVVEYPVTFILLDAQGETIAQRTETTYLLPGSIQYAVALNIPVRAKVAKVEVQRLESPLFVALPSTLTLPSFGTLLQERTQLQRGSTSIEQQVGLVTNNSTFDFQRVEVVVVGVNEIGRMVGVGKTFVGELKVGEQRQFTVQWPAASQASRQVVLLAATNIFKEENIIRAIGDPSLLR